MEDLSKLTAHGRMQFEAKTRPMMQRVIATAAEMGMTLDITSMRAPAPHQCTVKATFIETEMALGLGIAIYEMAGGRQGVLIRAEDTLKARYGQTGVRLFQRRGFVERIIPATMSLLREKTEGERKDATARKITRKKLLAHGFQSEEDCIEGYWYRRGRVKVGVCTNGLISPMLHCNNVEDLVSILAPV